MKKEEINWIIDNIEYIEKLKRDIKFDISEFSRDECEERSFMILVDKEDFCCELDAFIILIEKLEYEEQEWGQELFLDNKNRIETFKKFLFTGLNNMFVKQIPYKEFEERVNQYLNGMDYLNAYSMFRCKTQNADITCLFDDWNLYQVFGVSEKNYFIYLWYTTA
ncbi:hypothetical protein [Tepidibacter mesophilus]|uniref:hypothetical protein n=1 Tax=Tepidibacter mesophilus TaxID=655607 RepID=UPI000C08C1FF|nr:hypothetical protein [Tepidibacter mesophilus]